MLALESLAFFDKAASVLMSLGPKETARVKTALESLAHFECPPEFPCPI